MSKHLAKAWQKNAVPWKLGGLNCGHTACWRLASLLGFWVALYLRICGLWMPGGEEGLQGWEWGRYTAVQSDWPLHSILMFRMSRCMLLERVELCLMAVPVKFLSNSIKFRWWVWASWQLSSVKNAKGHDTAMLFHALKGSCEGSWEVPLPRHAGIHSDKATLAALARSDCSLQFVLQARTVFVELFGLRLSEWLARFQWHSPGNSEDQESTWIGVQGAKNWKL